MGAKAEKIFSLVDARQIFYGSSGNILEEAVPQLCWSQPVKDSEEEEEEVSKSPQRNVWRWSSYPV